MQHVVLSLCVQLAMAGALDAYLAAGVPANKIALGLATYGRTFQLIGDGDQPGVVPASGVSSLAQLPLPQTRLLPLVMLLS